MVYATFLISSWRLSDHHGDDFLPTNDLAWVGFSVEIGPEGGVYILDWHDQNICGNEVKFPLPSLSATCAPCKSDAKSLVE
mgnify:CR=1 FL=1